MTSVPDCFIAPDLLLDPQGNPGILRGTDISGALSQLSTGISGDSLSKPWTSQVVAAVRPRTTQVLLAKNPVPVERACTASTMIIILLQLFSVQRSTSGQVEAGCGRANRGRMAPASALVPQTL